MLAHLCEIHETSPKLNIYGMYSNGACKLGYIHFSNRVRKTQYEEEYLTKDQITFGFAKYLIDSSDIAACYQLLSELSPFCEYVTLESFKQRTILDEKLARRQIDELRDELKVTRQFLNKLTQKSNLDGQGFVGGDISAGKLEAAL